MTLSESLESYREGDENLVSFQRTAKWRKEVLQSKGLVRGKAQVLQFPGYLRSTAQPLLYSSAPDHVRYFLRCHLKISSLNHEQERQHTLFTALSCTVPLEQMQSNCLSYWNYVASPFTHQRIKVMQVTTAKQKHKLCKDHTPLKKYRRNQTNHHHFWKKGCPQKSSINTN